MARKLKPLARFDTSQFQPTEDMLLKPIPIGGLKGMNKTAPLPAMDPELLRLVRNLNIRYGAYNSRNGTEVVGTIAGSELLYACDILLPSGGFYIVRWRTNGVDVFANGVWNVAGGAAFVGLRTAPFALTGWNDRVLFTAGVGKVYELVFEPAFVVTELTESPTDVIHLATFNGRVMASLKGTTVQWTSKFDHTDWDGLGSGFEDLLSAPGGRPDQQTAIIPISDEVAYCLRTASVWQVGNTGDFDSPFSFTRVYTHIGSKFVNTVAATKDGFVAVGDAGQVWSVSPQGAVDIAPPVSKDFDIELGYQRLMCGAYDVKFDEYRVTIPSSNMLTAQKVMRYSFMNQAWTEDIYPFPIKSMAYTQFAKVLSIDELTGSIDDLVGTIDDLGVGVRHPGCIYAMEGDAKWVARDDEARSSEPLRDTNFGGARVSSGFRMESGDIKVTDPIKRQEFAEIICWYQSDRPVTLNFDYSYDGGVTWNLASQLLAPATGERAKPISINRTADREHLQFAVSTEASPSVRIISVQAMIREGARIVDAS